MSRGKDLHCKCVVGIPLQKLERTAFREISSDLIKASGTKSSDVFGMVYRTRKDQRLANKE